MRGERPAGFADQHRMLDARVIADFHHLEDDVVGVLLQRVVHRGAEVRLAAVVIHGQAAADVEKFQAGAQRAQLDVKAGAFLQGGLHAADVADLAADVEMQQPQTIKHIPLTENIDDAQHLTCCQAELGCLAACRLPTAGAARVEFRAHAEDWAHAVPVGQRQNEVQFAEHFQHDDNLAAELGPQQGQLDVLPVFIAVADDQAIDRIGQGQHRQQLGLRSRFQTKMIGPAELNDRFDHLPFLIDFDRIHAAVRAAVFHLPDGRGEAGVKVFEAPAQNFGKPDEQRRADAARFNLVHELLQVDRGRRIACGMDHQTAVSTHGEKIAAPRIDAVQLGRIARGPGIARLVGISGTPVGRGLCSDHDALLTTIQCSK